MLNKINSSAKKTTQAKVEAVFKAKNAGCTGKTVEIDGVKYVLQPA